MKIEERLLKAVKAEYSGREVIGLRFIKKTSENSWKLRFTYRDGDFLSLSDEIEIEMKKKGLTIVPTVKKSIFVPPGISTIEFDSSNKKVTKLNK